MAKRRPSPLESLVDAPRVRRAARGLVEAVAEAARGGTGHGVRGRLAFPTLEKALRRVAGIRC